MIVAVRQALDYKSTARAVAVCVVGWLLALGFAVAFGFLFAPPLGSDPPRSTRRPARRSRILADAFSGSSIRV